MYKVLYHKTMVTTEATHLTIAIKSMMNSSQAVERCTEREALVGAEAVGLDGGAADCGEAEVPKTALVVPSGRRGGGVSEVPKMALEVPSGRRGGGVSYAARECA